MHAVSAIPGGLPRTPNIRSYAEAQARLDELPGLVLNGEPQLVTLPGGQVAAVRLVGETSRNAEGKPFVSGLATSRNAPRDAFNSKRLPGEPCDIDL